VRNEFGRVANIVKGGEPVAVTQHGQPTLMILPFAEAMEAQRLYKAVQLVRFMKGLSINDVDPMLSLEEIKYLCLTVCIEKHFVNNLKFIEKSFVIS